VPFLLTAGPVQPALPPGTGPHALPQTAASGPTAAIGQPLARSLPGQTPGAQILAGIEQSAAAGRHSFTLRLYPEELGRVEVRLDFQDGRVQALVAAERPATLDLLQRDARWLERAMDQAGFKFQPDGLQFTLRDGRDQGGQPGTAWGGTGRDGGGQARHDRLWADAAPGPEAVLAPARTRVLDGVVDIRV
jgi:hypothetical protein